MKRELCFCVGILTLPWLQERSCSISATGAWGGVGGAVVMTIKMVGVAAIEYKY